MARVVDHAVCLRHWDWSETSQTVSILTRAHGVVRAVAKGSKRDRAPFSGGLEIATLAEVVFIPKQGVLSTITSWDLIELFPGVRRSTLCFFAAMHLLDLAHHFVQEGDPHPLVFDALCAGLRELGQGQPGEGQSRPETRAVLRMQWTCLNEAGLQPALDRSAEDGVPLASAASYGLSPTLGGLVADPGPSPPAGVLRVRAETVALLRRLTPDGGLPPDEPPATAGVVERASRLLAVYVQHVLGRPLASSEAFFGPSPRG